MKLNVIGSEQESKGCENYDKRWSMQLLVGVVIVACIVAVVIYSVSVHMSKAVAVEEFTYVSDSKIITNVASLMVIPDEDPIVATVIDKEKVHNQKFFTNAENGDKLLAFTKSMKAVLYRPLTNKIIEVATILPNRNIDDQFIHDAQDK